MVSGEETRTFPAMHAVATVVVPEDSGSSLPPGVLADGAEAVVRRLGVLLSPKGEGSDIARLNSLAAGDWVEADPMTIRVVRRAQYWHDVSEGVFEPTIAPLKRLFQFNGGELERWPGNDELTEAKARVGAEKLLVDRENRRLGWSRSGMSLDLGAIAKGFAADMAACYLQDAGVTRAIVNVGGEMRVLGMKSGPQPEPWKVSINSPRNKGEVYVAEIYDRALASSGDYESYFEYRGRRYSHIIDPATGLPLSGGVAGVTVTHPSSAADADALATILSVLGSDRGIQFLEGNRNEDGIHGVEAVFFEVAGEDGGIRFTKASVTGDGVAVSRE